MEVIRKTDPGLHWSGATDVVAIFDTVAGYTGCGDTGTGVTAIRSTIAGCTVWGTGTGVAMIRLQFVAKSTARCGIS